MITDDDIIAFRNRLIVARDEVLARLEDSTHDDYDEWLSDQEFQRYQHAINALIELLSDPHNILDDMRAQWNERLDDMRIQWNERLDDAGGRRIGEG